MSEVTGTAFVPLSTSSEQHSTNTSLLSYLHQAVTTRLRAVYPLRRSYSASDVRQLAGFSQAVADPTLRPRSSHTLPSTPVSELQENTTMIIATTGRGIDWFTTETGFMLCSRAHSQAIRDHGVVDSNALRDHYIDGLTYLLRALPSDLTPLQLGKIDNALPGELRSNAAHGRRLRACSDRRMNANILSRGITFVMVQIAVFLSLILPLLMGLLNHCLRYERQHRVLENLFQRSLQGVESLGERGLDLKDSLIRFGDGRVGGAVFRGVTWVAEGVVQGVSEGAGKGVLVVGSVIASDSQTT